MVNYFREPIDVIAPNLKVRLSGVTTTIAHLVPLQSQSIGIVATGPGLPPDVPHLALWRVLLMPRRLRVWHARRNNELLLGLILKWLKISKLKVMFTSASPRPRSRWTKLLVTCCDQVVATNQINAAAMPRSCLIVPHGVNLEIFSPAVGLNSKSTRIVGCFGRIGSMKGTADLVEALCRVLPTRPDWSGHIMGRTASSDQYYLDGIQEIISKAGLEKRITIVPEAPITEMPDSYRRLSLYVSPSHLEGFGLTVAEALATGVPTVATRGVGAFDELIDEGENGFLFPPGDINELVRHLSHIMDNEDFRSSMALQARASASKRMSFVVEAERLIEIYKELLLK